MPASTSPLSARHLAVDSEERLAGQFPRLALAIHAAVTAGHDFDQARKELHHALSALISAQAEREEILVPWPDEAPAGVEMLADAAAAQWRFLRARADELAKATTGLDAVALTRTLHAVLNLHLDLERRILTALREPPQQS
ncbi:MAG: hypothetical protein ACYC3K_09475 [Candidatus Nanopelagicales bacterium]